MRVRISTRRLATAALASVICFAPATAQATEWSLLAGYWDTESLGDSYGVGGRAAFFSGRVQLEVGATYYQPFSSEFVFNAPGGGISVFEADTEVIPIEIGVRYNLGASRFYLAAGGSAYHVNSNVDDLDDEWGLYYRVGGRLESFFVEVAFRQVEGSLGFDLDLGFDDDDLGLPVTRSRLGLSGLVVNAGWRF